MTGAGDSNPGQPPVQVVLISTYEMGRQPFGLASPAAWLRDAGFRVHPFDVSRQAIDWEVVAQAGLVAFFLPMHTATRLAGPLIERVRRANPRARLCAHGLYAPLNERWLRSLGVEHVLGGEFEADLVALASAAQAGGMTIAADSGRTTVPRLAHRVPDRSSLPPPARYASLVRADGTRTVTGSTEASRGCKHLCRHCPVVPVYGGQFRIVPVEVVLADIRQQVEQGARHITFGDPDFFNGIGHARAVVRALASAFPGLTYDVTIKIEHLVTHAGDLALLRDTGCLFVTSAVESIDDRVLARLEKGHTRADVERAIDACTAAGISLAPTFVAFTPWTTAEGYAELLDFIEASDLTDAVAPVQLAIRLLVTEGSRLLELEDIRALVQPFDPATLAYPWRHPDPAVDALQREIEGFVAARGDGSRGETFVGVRRILGRDEAERRAWPETASEGPESRMGAAFGGPTRPPTVPCRCGFPGAEPRGADAVSSRTAGPHHTVVRAADHVAGLTPFEPGMVRQRPEIAWLDEPWYC